MIVCLHVQDMIVCLCSGYDSVSVCSGHHSVSEIDIEASPFAIISDFSICDRI